MRYPNPTLHQTPVRPAAASNSRLPHRRSPRSRPTEQIAGASSIATQSFAGRFPIIRQSPIQPTSQQPPAFASQFRSRVTGQRCPEPGPHRRYIQTRTQSALNQPAQISQPPSRKSSRSAPSCSTSPPLQLFASTRLATRLGPQRDCPRANH